MLRVLLVEDELLVRTGMKSLIDWEAHGFTLVAEAAHGEEALHTIETQPVDIVITDIRMPVMDGLELIRTVRSRGFPCEFIVLSSYDDFPYVREAMVLQVRDYIHKPTMTPDELIETMKRVAAEFVRKQSEARYKQIVMETVEESRERMLEKWLRHALVSGEANPVWAEVLSPRDAAWMAGPLVFAMFCLDRSELPVLEPYAERPDEEQAVRDWLAEQAKDQQVAVCIPERGHWCMVASDPAFVDGFAGEFGAATGFKVICERMPSFVTLEGVRHVYPQLCEAVDRQLEQWRKVHSLGTLVRDAVTYMKEHYAEALSLEKVSSVIHISPVYFSRLFQKETGMTFIDYLTWIRVEQAKQLLAATDCPVYEIAEKVGYKSSKYFLRVFKRLVGTTPGEYRGGQGRVKIGHPSG